MVKTRLLLLGLSMLCSASVSIAEIGGRRADDVGDKDWTFLSGIKVVGWGNRRDSQAAAWKACLVLARLPRVRTAFVRKPPVCGENISSGGLGSALLMFKQQYSDLSNDTTLDFKTWRRLREARPRQNSRSQWRYGADQDLEQAGEDQQQTPDTHSVIISGSRSSNPSGDSSPFTARAPTGCSRASLRGRVYRDRPDLDGINRLRVQRRLLDKGYTQVGKADGILGSRTRCAIMAMQRDQGVEATGAVDDQTFRLLGLEAQRSGPRRNTVRYSRRSAVPVADRALGDDQETAAGGWIRMSPSPWPGSSIPDEPRAAVSHHQRPPRTVRAPAPAPRWTPRQSASVSNPHSSTPLDRPKIPEKNPLLIVKERLRHAVPPPRCDRNYFNALPPTGRPGNGDTVFVVDKVECGTDEGHWALIYQGKQMGKKAGQVAVVVTRRFALRWIPGKEGVDRHDWYCVPRRAFCYSEVEFSAWQGRFEPGDRGEFPQDRVYAGRNGIILAANQQFEKTCAPSSNP